VALENDFGGLLAKFIARNTQGGEIWNEALPQLVIVKSCDGKAPRNVPGEALTFQCSPDGRYITGKNIASAPVLTRCLRAAAPLANPASTSTTKPGLCRLLKDGLNLEAMNKQRLCESSAILDSDALGGHRRVAAVARISVTTTAKSLDRCRLMRVFGAPQPRSQCRRRIPGSNDPGISRRLRTQNP
jgi:hypothetical protein